MNLAEHKHKIHRMLLNTFPNHKVKELNFNDISYFDTFPDTPSVFLLYNFELVASAPIQEGMFGNLGFTGNVSIGLTSGSLSTLTIHPLKPL